MNRIFIFLAFFSIHNVLFAKSEKSETDQLAHLMINIIFAQEHTEVINGFIWREIKNYERLHACGDHYWFERISGKIKGRIDVIKLLFNRLSPNIRAGYENEDDYKFRTTSMKISYEKYPDFLKKITRNKLNLKERDALELVYQVIYPSSDKWPSFFLQNEEEYGRMLDEIDFKINSINQAFDEYIKNSIEVLQAFEGESYTEESFEKDNRGRKNRLLKKKFHKTIAK